MVGEAPDGEIQRVHRGAAAVGSGEHRRRGRGPAEGEVPVDHGRDDGGIPGDRARDGEQRVELAEAFQRTGGVQELRERVGMGKRAGWG